VVATSLNRDNANNQKKKRRFFHIPTKSAIDYLVPINKNKRLAVAQKVSFSPLFQATANTQGEKS